MQIFSQDDSQPALIAVGMNPIGVIAIGISPVGVIAIACGVSRGIVSVSCGGAVGIFTVVCGLGCGVFTAAVGLGLGIKSWGMAWGAFDKPEGDSGSNLDLLRRVTCLLGVPAALVYFGLPAWRLATLNLSAAHRRVEVTWKAKVTRSLGQYLPSGTDCVVSGTFNSDGDSFSPLIGVACGGLTLFTSGAIRSGSVEVSGTDDLACRATQTHSTSDQYVYDVACTASQWRGSASSNTAQFPARPSLDLDTAKGRAQLKLDGLQGMVIDLAVEATSAPQPGPPLFDKQSKP